MKFRTLREANMTRIPLFKNARGEIVHNADGSDWTLSQWSNAVLGELGEAANIIKKIERGDVALDDRAVALDPKHRGISVRAALGKEFADVACYLDILAFRAGVDLGEAVRAKFNEISRRVKVDVFIVPCEIADHDDPLGYKVARYDHDALSFSRAP